MDTEKVKIIKIQRFQYLNKFYDLVDGDETKYVGCRELGEELGLDKNLSYKIAEYLSGEFLLEFVTTGGGMKITHLGIKEVEEAIEEPDKPTEHFLPVNVIQIQNMNNSQIQQGTINSNQQLNINPDYIPKLQEILEKIRNSLDDLLISKQDKEDVFIELDTIAIQLKSSKPKKTVVQECFSSTKKS